MGRETPSSWAMIGPRAKGIEISDELRTIFNTKGMKALHLTLNHQKRKDLVTRRQELD